MANRDTVKQWFLSKKKPTQAQFHQLFDWLFFKEESIAIANVTGLQDILNSLDIPVKQTKTFPFADAAGTKTFVIPAGYVVRNAVFESASNQLVRIGDTANGEELLTDLDVVTGQPMDTSMSVCSTRAAARTIYVNSSVGDITVTITYTKFFKP